MSNRRDFHNRTAAITPIGFLRVVSFCGEDRPEGTLIVWVIHFLSLGEIFVHQIIFQVINLFLLCLLIIPVAKMKLLQGYFPETRFGKREIVSDC